MGRESARDSSMYNQTDRGYNIELDNNREQRALEMEKKKKEKDEWACLRGNYSQKNPLFKTTTAGEWQKHKSKSGK